MKKTILSYFTLIALCASSSYGQVTINEVLASNQAGLKDPDFGGYADWIELKNSSSSTVNIGGYYLSDSETTALKWKIPAGTTIAPGGYLVIYADDLDTGLHTNFKISASGEPISLFSASATLVDLVVLPVQFPDQSYGRNSSGQLVYMPNVTPGAANNTSTTYNDLTPMPTLSPAPGTYTSGLQVSIAVPVGAKVYYTTDGSQPTTSSNQYSSPISINSTSVVKAVSVEVGKAPSQIEMGTYLIGKNHALDIISLTAETYEPTGGPNNNLNINGRIRIDWTEKSGKLALSQYADFNVSGNSSPDHPQLNGKLYAKEKYGSKYFNYKVFPNKNLQNIESFMLRNASQDFLWAHMRDGLASRIISQDSLIDVPYEDFHPAALYVNGIYEGLIHVREDDDKYYAKQNFGQSKGSYQKEVVNFTDGIDLQTSSGQSQYMNGYIDLQALNFYYSFLSFTGQGEFGGRIWRDSVTKSMFQLHMHDWDQIFTWGADYFVQSPTTFNYIAYFNADAKADMQQLIAAELNLLFTQSRLLGIFDSLYNEIQAEMVNHTQRLADMNSPRGETTWAGWKVQADTLRQRLSERTALYWDHFKDKEAISTFQLNYSVNDENMGLIRFHGILANSKSGQLNMAASIPLRLEAVPKPGYEFVGWGGALSGANPKDTVVWSSNQSISANFRKSTLALSSTLKFSPTKILWNEAQKVVQVQGQDLTFVELLDSKGARIQSENSPKANLEWNLKSASSGNYYLRTLSPYEGSKIKQLTIH